MQQHTGVLERYVGDGKILANFFSGLLSPEMGVSRPPCGGVVGIGATAMSSGATREAAMVSEATSETNYCVTRLRFHEEIQVDLNPNSACINKHCLT